MALDYENKYKRFQLVMHILEQHIQLLGDKFLLASIGYYKESSKK